MDGFDSRARVNKNSVPQNRSGIAAPGVSEPQRPQKANQKPRAKWAYVITATVVAAVAVVAAVGLYLHSPTSVNGSIDGDGYQAVFLNDGQVYFGKLHTLNGDYVKITDVYYMQGKAASATNPQPATPTAASTSNIVELVRLTSAVHGPKNEMIINKSQVAYFENLSSDGQAAKLIASDKAKK